MSDRFEHGVQRMDDRGGGSAPEESRSGGRAAAPRKDRQNSRRAGDNGQRGICA